MTIFFSLIFLLYIFLELASISGSQIGGRSYNFLISILVMFLYLFHYLKNRKLSIEIYSGLNLIVISFFLFGVLSILMSLDIENSRGDISSLLQLVFYFICAEIIFSNKEIPRNIFLGLSFMGFVISLFILLNIYSIFVQVGTFNSLTGASINYKFLLNNRNSMAYALLICLQFPLNNLLDGEKFKKTSIILLTIMTVCIIFTQSRTGVILLFLFLSQFLFSKSLSIRYKLYTSIFSIVLVLLLTNYFGTIWYDNLINRFSSDYIEESSFGELGRLTWWPIYFKEWLDYPFFGIGQSVALKKIGMHAHNTYLYILIERGIFTFLCYITLCSTFLFNTYNIQRNALGNTKIILSSILGILITHYLFSFTGDFHNSKFIWLIFSMIIALKTMQNEKNNQLVVT